jgi:N6-adenosine-specific RNA methylase IME4
MGLPNSRAVRQLIVEPLREHSRKPYRVHADIQAMFAGPYVELFARRRRKGWASWGNQLDRFTGDHEADPAATADASASPNHPTEQPQEALL